MNEDQANQQNAVGAKLLSVVFQDFQKVFQEPNMHSDSSKSVSQILGGFLILDDTAPASDIMVV
jgi:hypothetical protein